MHAIRSIRFITGISQNSSSCYNVHTSPDLLACANGGVESMLWFGRRIERGLERVSIANTSAEAEGINLLAESGTLADHLSFQLALANEESALAPGRDTAVGVS